MRTKFQLTENFKFLGHDLYLEPIRVFQIRALIDIPEINVKAGDFGGYVQKESNLSHSGNCWIFSGDVFGSAFISGNSFQRIFKKNAESDFED